MSIDILNKEVKNKKLSKEVEVKLRAPAILRAVGIKIAVDFDGTCVTHEYPKVGEDIGAVPVLQRLARNGHKLILNTMRDGEEMDAAVQWFEDNHIPLYSVGQDRDQHKWTKSPKCYANLYIDDAALGCPLIYPEEGRPYVDWKVTEKFLALMGLLSSE